MITPEPEAVEGRPTWLPRLVGVALGILGLAVPAFVAAAVSLLLQRRFAGMAQAGGGVSYVMELLAQASGWIVWSFVISAILALSVVALGVWRGAEVLPTVWFPYLAAVFATVPVGLVWIVQSSSELVICERLDGPVDQVATWLAALLIAGMGSGFLAAGVIFSAGLIAGVHSSRVISPRRAPRIAAWVVVVLWAVLSAAAFETRRARLQAAAEFGTCPAVVQPAAPSQF